MTTQPLIVSQVVTTKTKIKHLCTLSELARFRLKSILQAANRATQVSQTSSRDISTMVTTSVKLAWYSTRDAQPQSRVWTTVLLLSWLSKDSSLWRDNFHLCQQVLRSTASSTRMTCAPFWRWSVTRSSTSALYPTSPSKSSFTVWKDAPTKQESLSLSPIRLLIAWLSFSQVLLSYQSATIREGSMKTLWLSDWRLVLF